MKTMSLAALVVCGLWAIGCTTVVVQPQPQGPEVLLPGEFIESVDANTILVKCSGKGPDQMAAINNARKGCLEWFIVNQLSATQEERQAYQTNQQKLFAQLDRYVNLPPPGASDGKGKGVKSQVRLSDTEIKVDIITDVHKQQLQDDLVAMGIMKSKSDMLEAVGMPTILVQPSKANKGLKARQQMESAVTEYLTMNKWEVKDPQGVADLNKMIGALGEATGAEEDEAAKIAMAVGADIYMVFEALQDKGGDGGVAYGAMVKAYETTTSRKLGEKQVIGPARASWKAGEDMKAWADALRDATGQVVPQIMGYWKEDAPKGNRFTVVINNTPKGADIKVSNGLKRACAFVKVTLSTAKTLHLNAQCKGDNMEVAGALDEILGGLGGEYEFGAKSGNLLLVNFK